MFPNHTVCLVIASMINALQINVYNGILRYRNFVQIICVIFLMEASRRAYKRNITLNSVRQHNCFITQGNYIGYMFRL